jgi:hypothetical protein
MSQDDLEGIKNQIHSRINRIKEGVQVSRGTTGLQSREDPDEECHQIVQGRLRNRRTTVL